MNPLIFNLIKNPSKITYNDLEILDQEIVQYPYMQSLHALRLKALYQFQHEDYKVNLSKTAIYTTDKKLLHRLIFGDKIIENKDNKIKKLQLNSLSETKPIEKNEIKTEETKIIKELNVIEEQEHFNKLQDEILFEKEVEISNEKNIEKEINTSSNINLPIVEPLPNEKVEVIEKEEDNIIENYTGSTKVIDDNLQQIESEEISKLEKNLLENEGKLIENDSYEGNQNLEFDEVNRTNNKPEIINAKWKPINLNKNANKTFRNRVIIQERLDVLELKTDNNIDLVCNSTSNNSERYQAEYIEPKEILVEIIDDCISKDVLAVEELSDDKNLSKLTSISQKELRVLDFLQLNSTSNNKESENINQQDVSEINTETTIVSNVPKFISNWKHWLGLNHSNNSEALIVRKAHVIDQFIENNPKINKLKEESEINLVQIQKDRGDDISHLMTDTLAKMYLQQNYYTKASLAYEVLMKKHPEKKEYYLEKIKEIKDLKGK